VVDSPAVSCRVAAGASSTEVRTTGVYTPGGIAGPVWWTGAVYPRGALSRCTPCHSITNISLITETHGPVLSCPLVSARLTEGIPATGVRHAQVSSCEGAARHKGVPCIVFWAGAYCFVPFSFALGPHPTRRPPSVYIIEAGVHTLARDALALPVEGAVRELVAFSFTANSRVSLETWWTGAQHLAVATHLALSPRPTGARIAWILSPDRGTQEQEEGC